MSLSRLLPTQGARIEMHLFRETSEEGSSLPTQGGVRIEIQTNHSGINEIEIALQTGSEN